MFHQVSAQGDAGTGNHIQGMCGDMPQNLGNVMQIPGMPSKILKKVKNTYMKIMTSHKHDHDKWACVLDFVWSVASWHTSFQGKAGVSAQASHHFLRRWVNIDEYGVVIDDNINDKGEVWWHVMKPKQAS